MHISHEQEEILLKSEKSPTIESSLRLLDSRKSNPITYEMRTISCLLDKSICIQVIRMFKMETIPLNMLTDYGHVFAHNPEQRILI